MINKQRQEEKNRRNVLIELSWLDSYSYIKNGGYLESSEVARKVEFLTKTKKGSHRPEANIALLMVEQDSCRCQIRYAIGGNCLVFLTWTFRLSKENYVEWPMIYNYDEKHHLAARV